MYSYIMQRTQISLGADERALLDAEASRTGRSIASLIREAVTRSYGSARDADEDIRAIDFAAGAWGIEYIDGASYVEQLRSGGRLQHAEAR